MTRQVFRACAALVLAASPVTAQQAPAQKTPDAAVTVSIGDTTAPPDWELSVPVAAELAAGAQVGRLSVTVTYPKAAVEYVGVRGTETLKNAGFDVKAGTPASKADIGSVALEFAPAQNKTGTLPPGRIAIIEFKIAHDAEEKAWEMAAGDVKAWGPAPAAPVLKTAAAAPATLTVASGGLPIFACFFYMH
jgi:hypothetical protein